MDLFFQQLRTYKVAETYMRIKISATESNREKLISILNSEAETFGKQYFKGQVKFKIYAEEGSLKGKIAVYGTLIFLGVSNYGSFRDGLDRIISDSQHFSEVVIERTKQQDQTYQNNVERAERRLGLPGRLKRTLDRIESLEQNIDDLSPRELRQQLDSVKQDLSNIINILEQEEQQRILNSLTSDLRNSLPEPDNRGMRDLINRYAIKEEEIIIRRERRGN